MEFSNLQTNNPTTLSAFNNLLPNYPSEINVNTDTFIKSEIDKLKLICKTNMSLVNKLTKFSQLVQTIETSLITKCNNTVIEMQGMMEMLNENSNMFNKIVKNVNG